MFELYKKRGFSEYLNDSFAFLKLTGKHYFKSYFVICGGLLLIILVLSYSLSRAYMSFVMGSINGGFKVEELFGGNIPLFIGVVLLFFVLIIIFSVLSYLYPMVYLRLYDENKHNDFSTSVILDRIKSNVGRTIKFTLITTLISMTIGLFFFALMILLFITIIGIPVAFIGILAFVGVYNLAFYIYINDRSKGYRESFKEAFTHVRNNLWPIIGSNFAMMTIIQIVTSIFTMVPMMYSMGSMFTTLKETGGTPDMGELNAMFALAMVLSFLFSFVLQNLVIINNGMIYYTMQNDESGTAVNSEIDLIGVDSED